MNLTFNSDIYILILFYSTDKKIIRTNIEIKYLHRDKNTSR